MIPTAAPAQEAPPAPRWADLVMVGGMEVQKAGMHEILARARRLGRRTIVGGPYASSEPERMLALADHVVVGEPDEVFARDRRRPGSGHGEKAL